MFRRALPATALLILASGCDKLPPLPGQKSPAPTAAPVAAAPRPIAEGKALLDQGQFDAALSKLQELPDDPVGLYYQGLIHVRRGAATPLPDVGFRDEDKLAAQCFEKAIALKPEFAGAHFGLAELLFPYTLKRQAAPPAGKRRGGPKPPTPAPDDPDVSPERVSRAYQAALANDKTSKASLEALLRFAKEMKRPEAAEPVYLEMLARDKESAEPHIAYAEFLVGQKKDRLKAIEQYQLALVWKPQDPLPKDRICDIYIDWANEHFSKDENANADARIRDAQKFVAGPDTPQAVRIRELQGKLALRRR